MNKDNAKQFLPLVQALVDGKTIQYRTHDQAPWQDASDHGFSYGVDCYRIKPEPRRIWVNEYESEAHYAYDSEKSAQLYANGISVKRIAVEYVEVIK